LRKYSHDDPAQRLFLKPLCAPFLLLVMAVISMPSNAQQNLRIAATVNDEMISVLDLQNRLTLVAAFSGFDNSPETQQRLTPQVIQSLIDERIRMQEAKQLDITAAANEIEAEKADVEQQIRIKPGQLIASLEANGINPTTLLDQLEAKIVWTKIIRGKFSSTVQVSDEEIDEVIEEIKNSKGQPEYLVSEIYLPAETPQEVKDATELASRLIQQVQGGASFSAVARNFSQSTSAQNGGNLGWNQENQLSADVRSYIISLEPDQLSIPAQTADGVYIFQLRDKRISRGLEGPPQEPTKVTLHQLHLAANPQSTATDIETIQTQARKLSATATDCKAFDEVTKQFGSPLSGELGTFDIDQISQKMKDLVINLPVGQPSPPQFTGDGVIVLMVCDRQVPVAEPVDIETVRNNIRNQLTSERLLLASRRHLRDLRRAAFVDIRL